MTTFNAFLGCSLDGFIAGPNGDLSWLSDFDEQLGDTGYDAFFASVDAMVMGRNTYETVKDFDPESYKGIPMHVLSTTTTAEPQRAMGRSPVTIHPDIASARTALETAGAQRAYVDGGRTVQAFLAAGLLSEIIITRVPVLIGDGIPLFGHLRSPVHATLEDTRRLGGGAVQSTYRFSRSPDLERSADA